MSFWDQYLSFCGQNLSFWGHVISFRGKNIFLIRGHFHFFFGGKPSILGAGSIEIWGQNKSEFEGRFDRFRGHVIIKSTIINRLTHDQIHLLYVNSLNKESPVSGMQPSPHNWSLYFTLLCKLQNSLS